MTVYTVPDISNVGMEMRSIEQDLRTVQDSLNNYNHEKHLLIRKYEDHTINEEKYRGEMILLETKMGPLTEHLLKLSDLRMQFIKEGRYVRVVSVEEGAMVKRGRGRPRKTPKPSDTMEPAIKRGRGRPRKTPVEPTIKDRGR